MKPVVIYLISINVITFILYAVDKAKAKNNAWRIKESTLLLAAFFGGSLGALLGMKICHHKTKHSAFKIGVPVMLVLHIICLYMLAFR